MSEAIQNEREKKIRKSNELIQNSRYSLTLQQQKILLYLISKISSYDDDFKTYDFSILEFCRVCGIKHKSGRLYEDIKTAIKEIKDKPSFWITLPNGEQSLVEWIQKARISDESGGILKIRFDEDMRPYLLKLKQNFTQYDLIYTLQFKSKYSLRLYELIQSIHFHELEEYSRRFPLDELRRVLLPKEGKKKSQAQEDYKDFKDFKKRVLLPAVREISEYSDKIIEAEAVKDGKKVVAVEFHIRTKGSLEQLALRTRINKELDHVPADQVSLAELQIESE